jgi:hypothetical protein
MRESDAIREIRNDNCEFAQRRLQSGGHRSA